MISHALGAVEGVWYTFQQPSMRPLSIMTDNSQLQTAEELLARAHEVLLRTGSTVAVAESCTGGLLGASLTERPGSSAYFLGGVLAYADGVKTGLLGVDPEVIAAHGAVSRPVALGMAGGVRRIIGSDIGISITGIAGPTGGTDDKPVGTTFIGLSGLGTERVERFVWHGGRAENRANSVRAGLHMLVQLLEGNMSAVARAQLPRPQVGEAADSA
ncbi:MAG TPA: nicotinamide-nucleotide amidohydrolase family protein [Chloroflexia bacterium]|jgi:PncC family amidohydrolase|nr:nicotinamide-nucleotide amidohydrolase family protein [Chloroflexia bacterium]